jgi:hypothetical protein
VTYCKPSSAGTYTTGGTASGAGTKLDCIDDEVAVSTLISSDPDKILYSSASLPKKDSFVITLPTTTGIEGVLPRAIGRKDDGGVNSGRVLLISGGTEDDGGADIPLGTTHAEKLRVLEEDPDNPGNEFPSAGTLEVAWIRTV